MGDSESAETIKKLQSLLKVKESELEEAKKNLNRLENECSKLKKYNKDLIDQIDLTNNKLHILLGVCEKREDKQSQTDEFINFSRDDDSKAFKSHEKKPLKAADWARIAEEVENSREYIYEPTSQTYYSVSSGWYFYPKEKLYFDPKEKKYYTYDPESKKYELYEVSKETDCEKNSASHADVIGDSEAEYSEEEGEIGDSDDPDSQDIPQEEDDENNISCLRMIIRQSDSLELGGLLLVTCKGASIGRAQECDVIINDLTVSDHHANVTYCRKKRSYQILDCSSEFGSCVNGLKIAPNQHHTISHGDIIKIGDCELLLHHHLGKDVTCIYCEPGCVQAQISLEHKPELIGVVRGSSRVLHKQLKKRLGITWEEENIVSLPVKYDDRAKKRQKLVGSNNPYEKTGEGTSLDKPLKKTNKGFKMLEKLGWQEGESLGKTIKGSSDPLPLISAEGRMGLGYHGPSA